MKNLVFLTGAGISQESGLATFRDSKDSLWNNYNPEELASIDAWDENPKLIQEFYNMRRKEMREAKPNKAHQLITQFEDYFNVTVITTNVDNLHERAKSSNIIHLHGQLDYAIPESKYDGYQMHYVPGDLVYPDSVCKKGIPLRPAVVWFGENVPNYQTAREIIAQADIFVVIGTSLEVYPAADLVYEVKSECVCYYIDPAENYLDNFIHIQKKAISGMVELKTFL